MACQICLCAGFFIVIMLLCWATRRQDQEKSPAAEPAVEVDSGKTKYVRMDSTEGQVIKPPFVDPPLGEYNPLPESRYEARKFMELPRGGLSCPNKRWYDAIYNGGAETILDAPDGYSSDAPGMSKQDVQTLWKDDAVVRRRETRLVRMNPQPPHGMMV